MPLEWWDGQATVQGAVRTNNVVEEWHSRFAVLVGAKHPTIFKLIEHVEAESCTTEFVIENSLAQGGSNSQRRTYRARDERLQAIVADYHQIPVLDFLRAVAHTVEGAGRAAGVAGYDVLNEPNAFGAEENAALSKMYGAAVRAIRGAEKRAGAARRLILFEPSALWSETGSGAPPDFGRDRDVVYAPHIYTGAFSDGPITAQAFETALAEARGFGGAPVLTGEWGAARGRLDYFQAHLDLQDRFGISSTQWTWRESCGDPHQRGSALAGTVSTGTFAVWGVDCADNRVLGIGADLARVLARGYVRAAPGRLSSARWDVQGRALDAAGVRAREGVVLEAFYPGRGSVSAVGLRRVRASRVPGGELVTGAARGGEWRLRVTPRAKQEGRATHVDH